MEGWRKRASQKREVPSCSEYLQWWQVVEAVECFISWGWAHAVFLEWLSVVMLRPSRKELRLAVSPLDCEHSQSFSGILSVPAWGAPAYSEWQLICYLAWGFLSPLSQGESALREQIASSVISASAVTNIFQMFNSPLHQFHNEIPLFVAHNFSYFQLNLRSSGYLLYKVVNHFSSLGQTFTLWQLCVKFVGFP